MTPRLAFTVGTLALLALAAGTPAEAQKFRVVGFGDSITEAFPFDTGASSNCQAANRDTCGYLPRLAGSAYFDCGSSSCEFVNRGLSGENTTQGLTRIDQVLNEREWDLLILMEGTNDIASGVSPQTVEFNLREMVFKAKSRSIATAQASTIWLNPSMPRSTTEGRNQLGDKLSTLISGQAAFSRRCFVDARNQLCPPGDKQQNCFAKNYWNPPAGEEDFVGHPNARGYDLLAKEFFRVLGSAGEPGAAEIVSPSGEACGEQAKLTWTKETVAGTTCGNWFRVQIDGDGGNLLDAWYSEGDLCKGNDCTLISPVDFEDGTTYSIRVRTRSSRGYGPWTKEESFTSVPFAPKVVGELVAPAAGEYFTSGGVEATFRWVPTSDAKSYRIELVSRSAGVLADTSYPTEEICDETTCEVSLGDPLPTGEYTWRVLAENACGGGWSEPNELVIFSAAPTVAPAAVAPTARTFDSTPILRWQPVAGATEYEVEDPFGNSTILPAEAACVGGVCRLTSGALTPGPYSWRVRAVNPLGAGAWSAPIAFEVADCGCFEGSAAGGATYLLAVPPNWNGDLVIWSHRSNYFGIQEIEQLPALAQDQFDEGFALGTTSYSVPGWPLFKSNRDLEKVYTSFVDRHGEPTNVYLVGESVGALVSIAAIETADLGNVVGALTSCGPMAGGANWEAVLDLRLAYDAICDEVRGAAIPGAAKGLPRPNNLQPSDILSAVNVCTGIDREQDERTEEQQQRLEELLAINDTPESGFRDAMLQATFGFFDLVRDKRKLKGRLPVGNEGVSYGSIALNQTIQRAKPSRRGEVLLEKNYQPTGEVGDTKIISLHTTQDSVFFVENQVDFAELVPSDSLTTGIVREGTATHCGFDDLEELTAWRALKIWAEGGKKPKPKNLRKRCRSMRKTMPGQCRFLKRPKAKALDTRIRPRP